MKPLRTLTHCFWILQLSLVLSLVAAQGRLLGKEQVQEAAVAQIGLKEAVKHLVAADAIFVDARPFEAYKRTFIPSGESVPAGDPPTPEQMEKFRQSNKLLIVYCDGADCEAADQTARLLQKLEFDRVMVMTAGIRGWLDAGLPTTKYPDE